MTAIVMRAVQRRGIRRWVDCTLALLLFLGAAIGGASYWKRVVAVGGQPFYYQMYFEPAVMIGCGKGFVVARPQVPEMVPFLWRKIDSFSCAAIRPDAPLGTGDLYQEGSWRYLMLAVGYTWRLFGVSWSALGPLFGVLFGATIAALYAVFRLGMGPLIATAGAIVLSCSGLHLKYLPHLRDYAKAPFSLLLVFLLGLLVTRRATWKNLWPVAAAYGAVLGVGYGFRTDFLADIPPFFLVLALFLSGGLLKNARLKIGAAAVCAIVFLFTAWPVVSSLNRARGGCQLHVVALGFANLFSAPLGIDPAPYEVNREYLDEFAYTNITSYAARVHPGIGHIEFCEAAYGSATKDFLTEVVWRFPADVIVRAYASVLRIVELPFVGRPSGELTDVFHTNSHHAGLAVVAVATALVALADLRIGLFLFWFLVYFGGYPGIQFDPRHFFHLEFITWWAAGFLLQFAITDGLAMVRHRAPRPAAAAVRRAALALAGCVAVLGVSLFAARLYQQAEVRSLLEQYLAAPRAAVPIAEASTVAGEAPIRTAPHADPEIADLVSVDVLASRCGPHATIAFRYDDTSRRAYSRVFSVPRGDATGLTHIFMPVYEGFGSIALGDAPPGCVAGVYHVRDPQRFHLLLEALLQPDWKRRPLYQRIGAAWSEERNNRPASLLPETH